MWVCVNDCLCICGIRSKWAHKELLWFAICLRIACFCVKKLNPKARGTFKTVNWTLTNQPRHGQKWCYWPSCPHPRFDGHSSGALLPVLGSGGTRRSSAVLVNLIPWTSGLRLLQKRWQDRWEYPSGCSQPGGHLLHHARRYFENDISQNLKSFHIKVLALL